MYFVVVMGAFPSIAMGVMSAHDNIPPLTLRLARSLGARGPKLYRHFIISALLPGYIAGMKQAWAFSWRSLMAAEIIAVSPQLGIGLGAYLKTGSDFNSISQVIAAIFLILLVGIGIELAVFRPAERRILRTRGLTPAS